MADRTVESLMRDALKNAESGSSFITKAPVMGASLETIIFSTTKGNKVLCGIGIQLAMQVNGPVTAAAAKTGQMIDDFTLRIDNQLRVKSSNQAAFIEWADCVLDRVQHDATLGATGTARSEIIYPVSGVGGRQAQLDLDFATFATMYTLGTEGVKSIVITPFYTDMPMPQFSVLTGQTPATGTGAYKIQLSGDFIGNGYLSQVMGLGEATINIDDIRVVQEDGVQLYNQKQIPTTQYWQNIHQKTIFTPGGTVLTSFGVHLNPTLPWSINSTWELDVTTSGVLTYVAVFKNSPTATNEQTQGQPPTPAPEPRRQPEGRVTSGPNTRQLTQQNNNPSGGFRAGMTKLFNL